MKTPPSHPNDELVFGTPLAASRALCVLALAAAVLSGTAWWTWSRWAGDSPDGLRWLFPAMALVFGAAGLRPRNWSEWRQFVAGEAGIRFPSDCPQGPRSTWLSVPWNRIEEVRVARSAEGHRGVEMVLRLSREEVAGTFRAVELAQRLLGRRSEGEGTLTVRFESAFHRPGDVVARLEERRRAAPGHDRGRVAEEVGRS